MSFYNKTKWDFFINNNYNDIIKLNKFKNCNNTHAILEAAKLTSNDINKLINLFSNKLIYYDINKLNSYHVVKINSITEPQFNNIIKKENLDNTKYNFFEKFWNDNNNKRTGTISMVSCDNISPRSRSDYNNSTNDKLNVVDNVGNIAINTKYFGNKINNFGRIVHFRNKHSLRILNCYPTDKLGRYFFRLNITKIILGDDYSFNFIKGCYKGGCLGQESIYYLLEIYNYDRYYNLFNMYSKINTNIDNLHINLPSKYSFENFYNNPAVNTYYPSLDGLYYHDDSNIPDINININVHGTELLIFIPELLLNIISSKFIDDIINDKSIIYNNNNDDLFNAYVLNNLNNNANLNINMDTLVKINNYINNDCVSFNKK
jgi:hypothetical protein